MNQFPPSKRTRFVENAQSKAMGAALRTAREASGYSVSGLSQSTKITKEFIVALEEGKFDLLPGQIFGKGFIRNLSKVMGINADTFVRDYEKAWAVHRGEKESNQQEVAAQQEVDTAESTSSNPNPTRLTEPNTSSTERPDLQKTGTSIDFVNEVLGEAPKSQRRLRKPIPVRTLTASLAALGVVLAAASYLAQNPLPRFARSDRKVSVKAQKNSTSPGKVNSVMPTTISSTPPQKAEDKSTSEPVVAATAPEAQSPSVATPAGGATPSTPAQPSDGTQKLVLSVKEPLTVRLALDGEAMVSKDLLPNTYEFRFKNDAQILILDAAALELFFNDKSLGTLGSKGRVRRLSFAAADPADDKSRQ